MPTSLLPEIAQHVETNIMAPIRRDGFLPLTDFMAAANKIYYHQGTAFGQDGDFITAPEISQVFGELIGLWAAVVWQGLGMPAHIHIIEAGPGRGTLMDDFLRAARMVPAFLQAIQVHFIEQSPSLQNMQQAAIASHGKRAHWHDTVATLPPGAAIIIGNEFFDALPIAQWIYTESGWQDRVIEQNPTDNALVFGHRPLSQPPFPPATLKAEDIALGSIIEHSPAVDSCFQHMCQHIKSNGGAALFIDYGYKKWAVGDTLQAVSRHAYVPVLERPGHVDLTAHVNFESLRNIALSAGLACPEVVTQGHFLTQLGIEHRINTLIHNINDDILKENVLSGAKRLLDPQKMGILFKALACTAAPMAIPGFNMHSSGAPLT